MIQLVWLIPAFPLAAFLIDGLFGRRWLRASTGWIASAAVGASAIVAIGVFLEVLGGKQQTVVQLYRWIGVGDFQVNVAALIDPLSSTMLLVVTVVSFLIFVYSNGYMAEDRGLWRFFTWMSLFVFAMLILVMGDNYLLMFVGWEGVGLCSYLLIGFWFERPEPYYAAKKAFVMNRIGDWGYTIGIITIFLVFGSMNFLDVFKRVEECAPAAAIFHLATHAFFKALLFLGSGSVIHGLGGEQDMRRMGALRRKMPVTFWTMLIAGGALAALPPLAGFWSKDEIVGAAFTNGHVLLYAIGIVTAVLTAFYVTRALWMTFYGEPRDRHLYDHAHESPRVMILPLAALALGSVVLGIAIGFPPEQGFIHRFLGPAVEVPGAVEHVPELATILVLALVSVAAGVIGIAVAIPVYVRHRPDATAIARAAGPYYRILVNKYYVDELYDHRIVEAARAFAGASWAFDIHIIDGLANRIGWLLSLSGTGARRLQTGIVGNYALTIVAGLLLVLVAYGGYAAGVFGR